MAGGAMSKAFPRITVFEARNEFNCVSHTGETRPIPDNYLKLLRATREPDRSAAKSGSPETGKTSILPPKWKHLRFVRPKDGVFVK